MSCQIINIILLMIRNWTRRHKNIFGLYTHTLNRNIRHQSQKKTECRTFIRRNCGWKGKKLINYFQAISYNKNIIIHFPFHCFLLHVSCKNYKYIYTVLDTMYLKYRKKWNINKKHVWETCRGEKISDVSAFY